MATETLSVAASIMSVILSTLAIALSVAFYVQGTRASASALQTLAKIETLAATIHQHAFAMLEQTLQRMPTPVLALTRQQEEPRSQRPDTSERDKKLLQADLNLELENLDRLYTYLRNLQQQLRTPALLTGVLGSEEALRTDIQRIRDLIAVKRAQIREVYGVDFNREQEGGPMAGSQGK